MQKGTYVPVFGLKAKAEDILPVFKEGAVSADLGWLEVASDRKAIGSQRHVFEDLSDIVKLVDHLAPALAFEELFAPVKAICASGTVTHHDDGVIVEEIIPTEKETVADIIVGFWFASSPELGASDVFVQLHHVLRFAVFCNTQLHWKWQKPSTERLVFRELNNAPMSDSEPEQMLDLTWTSSSSSSSNEGSSLGDFRTPASSSGESSSSSGDPRSAAQKRQLLNPIPMPAEKKRVRFEAAPEKDKLEKKTPKPLGATSEVGLHHQATKKVVMIPHKEFQALIHTFDVSKGFLMIPIDKYIDDVLAVEFKWM